MIVQRMHCSQNPLHRFGYWIDPIVDESVHDHAASILALAAFGPVGMNLLVLCQFKEPPQWVVEEPDNCP